MRPVGGLSKLLGLAVAFAAIMGTATAQAAPTQNQAQVRAVRGTANYSTDSGANWKKLSVGAKLGSGSVIRTAPGSNVDLYLGVNGPVVRVTEDTTLGLDELSYENTGTENIINTELDLRNGRILGNVKKMAQASRYEVKTPQGVAGIRGTKYDISADGTVTVVEGQVVVVYMVGGQASTATVNAGQTARPPVQAGQPVQVIAADPSLIDQINNQINEAGRPGQGPTDGTPVVIITPEPIQEALQEGDRAKNAPQTPIGAGGGAL